MKELMSVKEAAQVLDIYPTMLRYFEERGQITPVQWVGNRRIYLREDVERLAAERAAKKKQEGK